jgi:hypothetical protein
MSATGTKRIIQAYLDNGGARMDEEAYQTYKLAILSKWLDGCKMFEMQPRDWTSEPRYLCLDLACIGHEFSVGDAITHLKVHRPEWFDNQGSVELGERDIARKAAKGDSHG